MFFLKKHEKETLQREFIELYGAQKPIDNDTIILFSKNNKSQFYKSQNSSIEDEEDDISTSA